MSDLKKSLWPTVIVVGAVGSFIAGNQVRVHQDIGSAPKEPATFSVASIELPTESPRSIPESEYFYQLTLLLERDFVDTVTDERKLAFGAVKGMIGGLWDPLSQFVPKDHFDEQLGRLRGEFTGIGVEIRPVYSPKELDKVRTNSRSADPLMLLPELQVAFVAPGGPAEKAGIKVGARIVQVNGKWLLAWKDVQKLRDMQALVTSGKLTQDAFKKVRIEIQKKAKASMTVGRAMDLLTTGTGRTITVAWTLGDAGGTATATSASTKVAQMENPSNGTIKLRMFEGVSQMLGSLTNTGDKPLTLDLRNSSLGDPKEIAPVLEKLAPKGEFGQFVPEKGGQTRTLVTNSGRSEPLRLRILVDDSTRGSAAVLAMALSSKAGAELVGKPNTDEAVWIDTVRLDDGSGYTLNTGKFGSETQGAKR